MDGGGFGQLCFYFLLLGDPSQYMASLQIGEGGGWTTIGTLDPGKQSDYQTITRQGMWYSLDLTMAQSPWAYILLYFGTQTQDNPWAGLTLQQNGMQLRYMVTAKNAAATCPFVTPAVTYTVY